MFKLGQNKNRKRGTMGVMVLSPVGLMIFLVACFGFIGARLLNNQN